MPGMHPAFAFFLVLSSTASALSQNSTAMLEFAAFAIPSSQLASIQPFSLQGSEAFAVASNNEVYGIFVSGLPFLENRPLTAPDEIENALAAYYSYQGYSSNITFSDVHAGLLSIMASHEKGEAKCRQITGTDNLPCNSFETCRAACLGTPFCPNFAAGGKPGEFIYALLAFENNSRTLDSAYLNESTVYSTLLDGITPEEARAYLDSLIGLNRAATFASKSALYDGYSYCFEPDYALPVITNMQLTAQKRYVQSEPFFTLSDKAKLVRSRTLAAVAASENEKDRRAAQAAKDAALAALNASSFQNASAPPGAPPDDPASGIFPLLLMSAAALAILLAAGGIFLARRKKKRRG